MTSPPLHQLTTKSFLDILRSWIYFPRSVIDSEMNLPAGNSSILRCHTLDIALVALLTFGTLAVYWPVRHFGWINFDDPQYVFKNPVVLSGLNGNSIRWAMTGNAVGNWQPVTLLSYIIDIQLFGPHPGAFHLENVIFHAIDGGGWYVLLLMMTRRRWPAFFVAAFFCVHPAHVESIAWISERKDVLSMLFLILSLMAYFRYTHRPGMWRYLLSLAPFAMALMAKVMMVTQPLLMLLLDVWPLGRLSLAKYSFARTARRLILEKLPYFLLSAIAGVLAVTLQSSDHATPDLLQLSVLDRVATAILGLTRYLGMAIYPREQSILYPYQFDPPMAAVIASALLLTLISAVLIRAGRRRPYLAVGWLWFVIAMLPVIGLIQAGNQAIADRYTYLPYIGLSIAAIWWIADIVESAPASQRRAVRGIAVTFGCAAVIGCIVQTHRYLPAWASTASLFSHAAEVNVVPDWNIEYHLAEGWVEAGRPDLAIEHYELTIAQRPDHVGAQNNLGNLLAPHFPELALPHYQIAVRADPDDATVHYDYGLCLDALHRPVEAAGQFRRVLQLQPDFPGARAALQRVNRQR